MYLLVVLSLIGLLSCEKEPFDSVGQIEGMGDNTGKLQVKKPYVLPEGILVIGEIRGVENYPNKSATLKSSFAFPYYGSGGFVRLQLTLVNTKEFPRTVFFPKGLVWQCKDRTAQHGLTCQTTWVCLQPNTTRTIGIDLYCANLGIPSPDNTNTYNILGVTSSQIMWNLLNTIGWRKINYEMYNTYTKDDGPTYEEIIERLQFIVHNLTNRGIDISEDDRAFIESIPELSPEEIPQVDDNSKYPEYFEEFKITGK